MRITRTLELPARRVFCVRDMSRRDLVLRDSTCLLCLAPKRQRREPCIATGAARLARNGLRAVVVLGIASRVRHVIALSKRKEKTS